MQDKIEITTERTVICYGEELVGGHPKVYLEIDDRNEIICPYCSKKFVFKEE